MTRWATCVGVACLCLLVGAVICMGAAQRQVSDTEAVVIPFDFVSRFDGGKMGRKVGELFWARLRKRGRFIIPESMLDVRDTLASQGIRLRADMGPKDLQRIVQELFGGHIAIWGSVERVPGARYDVYDLEIWIVDYRPGQPRVVYHKKARTKTVSEIPHVYVPAALDALYGTKTPRRDRPVPVPQYSEGQLGPNLVRGSFESGGRHPAGWDPLPKHVLWLRHTDGSGRFIRFDIPEPVAATSGVLYYSELFPVKEGQKYWFRVRWRSFGPTPKVFVKCYDALPTRFTTRRNERRLRVPGIPSDYELREVYRAQMNLKGPKGRWNVHVEEFTPRHSKYHPRWGRVMLYGYWPKGKLDWDDVEVRVVLSEEASTSR